MSGDSVTSRLGTDDSVTIGFVRSAPTAFVVGFLWFRSPTTPISSTGWRRPRHRPTDRTASTALTITSVVPHKEGFLVRSEESWDRNRAELFVKAGSHDPKRPMRRDLESG